MNLALRMLLIGVGAAVGANARYFLGRWISNHAPPNFPFGTLVVNVTGSILIGAALVLLADNEKNDAARMLVIVGALGGYTTFSTFSAETLALFTRDRVGLALLNALLSCSLSVLGAWIGYRLMLLLRPA